MRFLALLIVIASVGCGDTDVDTGRDSGTSRDSGSGLDSSLPDGSPEDSSTPDGAPADTGATPDSTMPPNDAGAGSNPSGGSGGSYPGTQTRSPAAPSGGTFDYTLYIPSGYEPASPMPLLTLFHGQGDSGSNMVSFWADTAEANGFILLATTSTGASGGWSGGADVGRYDVALNDALGAYNVERRRIYVWGFSAGGHLTHAIALMNTDLFAAYAVSAGILDAFGGGDAPASAARQIPVDVHIGMADPLYPGAMTDRERFTSAGWVEGSNFSWSPFDGGHTILPTHPTEIWSFLSPYWLP